MYSIAGAQCMVVYNLFYGNMDLYDYKKINLRGYARRGDL